MYAIVWMNNPWVFIREWRSVSPERRPITSIGGFLGVFINIVMGTAFAVSVIAIIFSGIKFIMAGSDLKAKGEAKKALTYSIIALLIAVGAFTIKVILFNVVGGEYGVLWMTTPNF
ncbi:MAG: hypothetical protein ABIK73_08730 [candidate division WOR-3 bacterium]